MPDLEASATINTLFPLRQPLAVPRTAVESESTSDRPSDTGGPNPLSSSPLIPPSVLKYLDALHAESLAQEQAIDPQEVASVGFDKYMQDKWISLDQGKCWFVYQMILATGARMVVEAGTSFGLSTIYLALALRIAHNPKRQESSWAPRVIATEYEPSKALKARETWQEVDRLGINISDLINLRQGDLLQTLKQDVGTVDILLLDIWAPLALPTLLLLEPSFRVGSMIIIDNSTSSAQRYADLLGHIRKSGSGYSSMTVPFTKGLEVVIWMGKK